MAEKSNLDRIEKLIVDGQKEVLTRVDQLDEKMDNFKAELKRDINDLKFEVKTLDTSVRAAHYDIKEIDRKLDEHIKQPAH
jgi:predicted  nucleic acid-binding Zn-ribbon protein